MDIKNNDLKIGNISIKKENGVKQVFGELINTKVIVNDIEITTREDWDRVINSLNELKEENVKLKKHNTFILNKIREYINKYHRTPSKEYKELLKELEEIIKGDK